MNTLSTHSAYIKVAEGCQHNCSFCIIPAIRGKLRSRPASSIIAEAKNLSESGVKEINLIAQDLAAYGRDRTDGADLLSLLKELVKIEKLHWIRLLYMYPENITQEFLQFFAEEKKLVKYLDIPIQHGSNKILKDMKRDVTIEEIEETISQLRAKVPTVAIRTSVMVGFPGETEKDFEDLASFVKRARIEHLGCFSYSKEDGTVAARMSDQVEEHVKKERQEKIMALQKEISRAGLEKHLGKTYEALIEKQDKKDKDLWLARLSTQAPEVDGILYVINTKETELNQGDMILVRIIETKEYDLIGETI